MKNLKKLTLSLLAIMFSFVVNAQSNDALYGKWYQMENEQGVSVMVIYDFQPDGTIVQEMSMNATQPKIEMQASATAQYTYNGDTIAFRFDPKDIEVQKMSIEGVDDSMLSYVIEQQKQEMAAQNQEFKNVKIEGNSLTATFMGQPVTLTRMN